MPATLVWNDSFKVGIATIDDQHKQLIDQLNVLVNALYGKKSPQEVAKIFRFLDMYINIHFSCEEGCMARYHCPAAANNKVAHKHFIANYESIKQQFDREGTSDALINNVNRNLLEWFINHIANIDTQLKTAMSKR